jgi:protein-tyrosine-phosphatase
MSQIPNVLFLCRGNSARSIFGARRNLRARVTLRG